MIAATALDIAHMSVLAVLKSAVAFVNHDTYRGSSAQVRGRGSVY